MFENHFIKSPKIRGGEVDSRLISPLESILYHLSRDNAILPTSYFVNEYHNYCNNNYDETRRYSKNPKDVEFSLENLSKLGFLKKLHSYELQKFVK